jgi:hypothetical protein
MDDDDLYSGGDGHWRVLPRWAKRVSILVGLPAWLALMIGVFSGRANTHLVLVAFGAFAGVAILQTVLLFRAYWRMEL